MTKRILLFYVGFLMIGLATKAQVVTDIKSLKVASAAMKIKEDANYQKALVLAKQKGWDLVLTNKNGIKAYLVGVFEDNSPKYYTTYNNTIAAATTKANQLWNGGASGLNLSGSSANIKNKLAIWDGGKILSTHVELTGRITQVDAPTSNSDHATHVTGTMIATGINPIARGMAYGIQGILAYDFNNDVSEITSAAANLVLSNHSYGIISGWYYNGAPSDGSAARWEFRGRFTDNEDFKFGYYNEVAKQFDDIAYNAPNYLIVKSAGNNRNDNGPAVGTPYFRFNASGVMAAAGNRPPELSSNDGYDIIPMDGNAKNILTVGAVNGIATGYNKPGDVVISAFSSWGPTDDGRIKPDIVADGVNVTSTVASGNTDYASLSGTSMSAPNATGSLLLLQEYYSQLKAGAFMRSATLKGIAIHTADEAGDAPGPDYRFGWGLLNVENGAAVIKGAVTSNNAATSEHLLYENVLAAGGSFTKTVIASGKGQLSATICWTDVIGTVTASASALNDRTIKLVNDLDIRITKGTTTYFPWILDPSFPAGSASKGDNIRDNVERINIDSVVPGQTYTITVSHKGTLTNTSQAYSLLVSGVGGSAICASAATSTVGTRIDSVGFGTIQNKPIAGCTTYKEFTNLTTDIEPNKAYPLSVKVNSCDGTNANKIVKVFIDYNGNGVFTDANELVATSGILTNGNIFTTTITTPAGLVKGNFAIMRVIAQETAIASNVVPCGAYANGETQDYRIRFVQSSNDIAITEIVAPITGSGSNTEQLIAVRITNNGSVIKTNIPLTATVSIGATTVATINVICPLTVPASGNVIYTFQKTFNSLPATTYTVSITASAAGDQDASNNTLTSNIAIAANPPAPAASGVICSTSSATFKITNPNPGLSYFWYSSATSTTPIGMGTTITVSPVPANNTVYVASGARANVGIKSKNEYPSGGGYQAPPNNYMKYSATAPVVLESVRLFTRFSGTLSIDLLNLTSEPTTGALGFVISNSPVNVYSSHPSPLQGAVAGNDAVDTGAIYYVGMPLPNTGSSFSYALRMTGLYSGGTDSVN
ncbi:MAG: S8 family serine peptidase, partial [Deinococcales bacterium]|nr:S8 family serine peptidase [Chitinophagaceae bacterium]